jgi:sugar (pentulose or hexulose) kinase
MKDTILVVDYGTSHVRAILFDAADGSIVDSAQKKYFIICPQDGYAELDPNELWKYSVECVKEVMDRIPKDVKVRALNFSFIGTSLFPVDENYEPTYNCILAFDSRAWDVAAEMAEVFTTPTFFFYKTAPSARVLFMKKFMPEIFAKTKYFWSIQQYILAKVGVEPVWDPTLACHHLFYDPVAGCWNSEIIKYAGITAEQLGTKIVGQGDIIGDIDHFGDVDLGGSVPVLVGSHDSDICFVGLGIIDEDEDVVGEVAGTLDAIGYVAKIDPNVPKATKWLSGPMKDTCIIDTGFPMQGAVMEWFMSEIAGSTDGEAYIDMWDHCDFDGTPHPVFMNPFLSGSGTFSGLYVNTTKYDLFKAVVLSLTFETRRSMEATLATKHGSCSRIRIGGGSANSGKWTQLRADINGMTFERMKNNEISAIGAAAIAAHKIGFYPTLRDAINNMVGIRDSFKPDMEKHALYTERFKEYIEKAGSRLG